MTVKELIEELKKFSEDSLIGIPFISLDTLTYDLDIFILEEENCVILGRKD
jgi:hypothetical protein